MNRELTEKPFDDICKTHTPCTEGKSVRNGQDTRMEEEDEDDDKDDREDVFNEKIHLETKP